jgi:hypothetical protein
MDVLNEVAFFPYFVVTRVALEPVLELDLGVELSTPSGFLMGAA